MFGIIFCIASLVYFAGMVVIPIILYMQFKYEGNPCDSSPLDAVKLSTGGCYKSDDSEKEV